MRKRILYLTTALLLLIGHYIYLGSQPAMTDAVRAGTQKHSIALTHGVTSYETANLTQPKGLVVLLHGLAIPSEIWNNTFDAFKKAGHPVLRYDLYGHGLSDRPDVRYDLNLYATQLAELLTKVAPNRKIILCGFSLGGAISVVFAKKHAALVEKHILIDSAGLPAPHSLLESIVKIPVIGAYSGRLFARTMVKQTYENSFSTEPQPQVKEAALRQTQYSGFSRAMTSTYRATETESMNAEILELAAKKIPTLIIWGLHDKLTPYANASEFRKRLPHAELKVFENSGHAPMIDEPDVVHRRLLEFLAD